MLSFALCAREYSKSTSPTPALTLSFHMEFVMACLVRGNEDGFDSIIIVITVIRECANAV